ncbi:MAG: hypothetical protein FD129_3061, partial [bacterium]
MSPRSPGRSGPERDFAVLSLRGGHFVHEGSHHRDPPATGRVRWGHVDTDLAGDDFARPGNAAIADLDHEVLAVQPGLELESITHAELRVVDDVFRGLHGGNLDRLHGVLVETGPLGRRPDELGGDMKPSGG